MDLEVAISLRWLWMGERGYSLVEVLVALGILSVLFGSVALALVGVGAGAEGAINNAELRMVQKAVDVYLVDTESTTITARTSPDYIEDGDAAWADGHLRSMPTRCQYAWSTGGQVVQGDCGEVICAVSIVGILALVSLLRRRSGGEDPNALDPPLFDKENKTGSRTTFPAGIRSRN